MAPTAEDGKRQRRAYVAAALTATFVALFALAFIGVVTMLNDYADEREKASNAITIDPVAPVEPFYVLLIGSDSRKGTALYAGNSGDHSQLAQYSDIMTLMRVDPQGHVITLVTIPRDTVLDGHDDKINASLLSNDPTQVVDAVGELTGVRADYYMMTTFISFENLVNALGGIDIDVPVTITVPDPATGKNVTVKQGKDRHLNGVEALVLARARKEYGDYQDVLRQVNVRNIERTMIEKVLDMKGELDVEHVLAALDSDTKTDIDMSKMGAVMLDFVEHDDEVSIYDCTGPYDGMNRPGDGNWVVPENEQRWAELMAVVNAGEDPSAVVEAPDFSDLGK